MGKKGGLDSSEILFYGAGQNAAEHFAEFVEKIGEPICFVDQDVHKIGTKVNFPLNGVVRQYDILSLQRALERYPKAYIYLTQVTDKLMEITTCLLKGGGWMYRESNTAKTSSRTNLNID